MHVRITVSARKEAIASARERWRTDDERKLLKVACTARVLDRLEPLRQKVLRVERIVLVDDDLHASSEKQVSVSETRLAPASTRKRTHQAHRLGNETTRHADVDGRLLPVARQDPHLDAGLLQRVDRVRHALLQLVLDGRRAEQKQVALDDLGRLVERLGAAVDGRSGAGMDRGPLAVLVLGNVAHRDAERPQALRGVLLQW